MKKWKEVKLGSLELEIRTSRKWKEKGAEAGF